MKIYLLAKQRLFSVLMTGLMAATLITFPVAVEAQSTSEKVRIMAEALRARDSGNLTLAREKAEELIRLVPNDTNAQRVLASINDAIERRGVAAPLSSSTSVASSDMDFMPQEDSSAAPASTPDRPGSTG